MQITSLQLSAAGAERLSSGAVRRTADAANTAAPAARAPSRAAPLHAGLARLDLELNRQAAALQRTLEFVDRAQSRLTGLKAGLSQAVAEQQAPAAGLSEQLRQFAAHWEQRAEATDGNLDADLRLVGAGRAQQRFSLAGLDQPEPQPATRERLLFTVQGRAATPVLLEPGLSLGTTARRLDQALAPVGVRVAADASGTLQFSAAENEWPAVSDSLMVKGEGRSFPTGQFNRVRSAAQPELVRPQTWRVDDAAAARQTLRDVVLTGNRLQAVAGQAEQALGALAPATDAAAVDAAAGERALRFVQGFGAPAQNASFALLASALPACLGLNRERVTALLRDAAPG